jgi:oligoribonuclease NrnB/cAMP/cGMP phosphodiesterase (DHH superfamily)
MKRACVYHRIDLDGWMSAAIVKHWFTETVIRRGEADTPVDSINFIGYHYGDPIPDLSEYDKVIMVDVSFPNEVMLELADRLSFDFIWIDHHQPKINEVSKYLLDNYTLNIDGLTTIEGRPKFAACELTWKYLFNETWNGIEETPMPEIVRLLGRYDCFGHKGTSEEQKVLEFQYGARAVISNMDDAYRYLTKSIKGEQIEKSILIDGGAIYQYLCTEAKQIYANGVEIGLSYPIEKVSINNDIDKPGINGASFKAQLVPFRFICINRERFNPINFGINYHDYKELKIGDKFTATFDNGIYTVSSIHPNMKTSGGHCYYTKDSGNKHYVVSNDIVECKGYDGVACFWYANGEYHFSLYNDNGEVDCSVIAKQYGGSGHKEAAGFRLSVNEFNNLINS